MPTYEYECSKCGHTFEQVQSMKDDPIRDCPNPKCKGKGTVKRLISSGGGLIFKGSGFYITDYKNAGAKSEGGESKESKDSKESKGDSKSESQASESGSGESKASESKPSESKTESKSESKPKTESKSSEAKSKPTKPKS